MPRSLEIRQPPAAGRSLLARYLARFDDGEVARWAFRGVLAGAVMIIGLDLKALHEERLLQGGGAAGAVHVEPTLSAPSPDPRRRLAPAVEAPGRPLSFELKAGGVLEASGSIDIGAARRFADVLDERGDRVRTLSLDSPGGSLDDAMAMARLARERGLDTRVADGALCASSCPLALAGGAGRSVGEKAAVGLHQFYAAADMAATEPAQAMSDAQATAARIARHLAEMGVDPALWLHALDTPPQRLYYLSREEMVRYRLVTDGGPVATN